MAQQETHFGYYFAKLHRLVIAQYRHGIMDLGIQPSQMPFIAELFQYDDPVTQDALSAALVIDKAATARALEQLEQKGFVNRMVNPNNRRQKLITVTDKAKAIQHKLFGVLQKASNVFVQDFSEEETNQTLDLLNRMIANALNKKL